MTPDTKQVEPLLTEAEVEHWLIGDSMPLTRLENMERLLVTVRALQQRDAQLLVMREALQQDAESFDCDTGPNGGEPAYCRKCEAERILSSTSQLASEVKERIERPLREKLATLGTELDQTKAELNGTNSLNPGVRGELVMLVQRLEEVATYLGVDPQALVEDPSIIRPRELTDLDTWYARREQEKTCEWVRLNDVRALYSKAKSERDSLKAEVERLKSELGEAIHCRDGWHSLGRKVEIERDNLRAEVTSLRTRVEALTQELDGLRGAYQAVFKAIEPLTGSAAERDALSAKCAELEKAATHLMRELSGAARNPGDPLLEPPPEFADPILVEQPSGDALRAMYTALASSPDSALARVEAKIRVEAFAEAHEKADAMVKALESDPSLQAQADAVSVVRADLLILKARALAKEREKRTTTGEE